VSVLETSVGADGVAAMPLLELLADEFAGPAREISVACDPGLRLRPVQLDALTAIIREALANAVKHAFGDGRCGRAWVTLSQERGRCRLRIADNGPGFPELGPRACPGRELIERLSHELGGYCRLDNRNYGGAEVTVVFPVSVAERAPPTPAKP